MLDLSGLLRVISEKFTAVGVRYAGIREYFDVFAMLPQWDELLRRIGHA